MLIGVFGSKKTRNAPQRHKAPLPVSPPHNNNKSSSVQPECFHDPGHKDATPCSSFPEPTKSVPNFVKEWLLQEIVGLFRKKARTVSLEACDIPENASAVTLEALALSFYTCDESISIWDALQTYVAVAKNPAALPENTLAVSKNGLALLFQDLPVPLQIAVKHANIKIIKDIYSYKPLMRRPPPR